MDEDTRGEPTEETPILEDAVSDEQVARQFINGGDVIMMMAVEGQGLIPVPITAIFQQLFGVLNHIDSRLVKIEEKLKIDPEGDSQIITLN